MTSKTQHLFLLMILIIVGYNMMTTRELRTDIEGYNSKIDSIQTSIDSIADLNSELDSKIESLHSELELIDGDINRVQNNLTVIKRNTNEKVSSISIIGDDELELFFAEWARQHKDTVE